MTTRHGQAKTVDSAMQKCQTIFPQADLAITRAEKEAGIVAE